MLRDAAGQPADLGGRANGAVIEVIVEEGALSFRVNDEEPQQALPKGAFSPGARLRPWARLYGFEGDRVGLVRGYVEVA